MIPRETVDLIFSTARLEEVIGEYVTLKRSGANLKGLSPFTDEKTPSFMVSPAKQIWKDFSSTKGGNVVTFLMEIEHFTYREALLHLAKKYNIEIKEEERTDEQNRQIEEKESLYRLSEYAAEWFSRMLKESQQGRAIGLSYFRERGFREETIDKFALGYSPDQWTAFTDDALKEGFQKEFLEKTGLTIFKEDGKMFDRFKGRVMFPIHTFSGRVAGFGGRTLLADKTVAKYLNSPESEIYHKSDILYGIYQAKGSIIKQDCCYLVEGYTDVISLWQAGVENVVASSGTSLTEGQIRLIKRLTQNITVLYDGDAAGIHASFRGIDMILAQGMNVRVLTFPDNDDPDSFSRKTSSEELKRYLKENQTDFISFKTALLLEDTQGDPILKAKLIRDIVVSISKISDLIKREVYVKECAGLLDVSESTLFAELAQLDKRSAEDLSRREKIERQRQGQAERLQLIRQEPAPKPDEDPLKVYEGALLKALILYGDREIEMDDIRLVQQEDGSLKEEKTTYKTRVAREIIEALETDELEIVTPLYSDIYAEIRQLFHSEEPIAQDHFIRHSDPEIVRTATDLILEKYPLSDWSKKGVPVREFDQYGKSLIKDIILRYKERRTARMIDQLKESLLSASEEEKEQILQNINDLGDLCRTINHELGERVI